MSPVTVSIDWCIDLTSVPEKKPTGTQPRHQQPSERLIYQKENKPKPHFKRFRTFDIIISGGSAGSDLDTAS